MQGKIVRIVSNLYTVDVSGKLYDCHARGKFRNERLTPLVGDICNIDPENNYILELNSRRNELQRPLIANVDIALIITSCKSPDLSLNLLDKLISNVIIKKIEPVICFTKLDLLNNEELKEMKKLIKYYSSIGIKVFTNKQTFRLKRYLKNKTIVLTGQTGAGKSTLLNHLDKKLNLKTQEISEALGRGKHTTRHVELFSIGKILIADTPGFSSLEFNNITKEELKYSFKEFNDYICEYKDCMHNNEKNCAIKEAVNKNKILSSRYENYLKFLKDVN